MSELDVSICMNQISDYRFLFSYFQFILIYFGFSLTLMLVGYSQKDCTLMSSAESESMEDKSQTCLMLLPHQCAS